MHRVQCTASIVSLETALLELRFTLAQYLRTFCTTLHMPKKWYTNVSTQSHTKKLKLNIKTNFVNKRRIFLQNIANKKKHTCESNDSKTSNELKKDKVSCSERKNVKIVNQPNLE